MATHQDMSDAIDAQLKRTDLTGTDILHLTVARRLNNMSDATFARAMGGENLPALNVWGKR